MTGVLIPVVDWSVWTEVLILVMDSDNVLIPAVDWTANPDS